ncbi:MAG: PDZ domain-containing protein [Pirellulales bacterium]
MTHLTICTHATIQQSLWSLTIMCVFALVNITQPVFAQTLPSKLDAADVHKLISQQIKLLNNPSYRVRQVAKYVVERHPKEAIEVIRKEINQVDAVVGVQLVDMVGALALHSDLAINNGASELLHEIANDATSVGRSARNSLSSLADLQEEKAIRILRAHGAYIGPQNFSIDGKEPVASSPRFSLMIAENFTGTDAEFKWIRFLKSVQVVYLRGSKITPAAVEATSHLKHLRGLKFRSCKITQEQLLKFADFISLDQFGLSYVNVDDSFIPAIEKLPIGESLRLYGTQITAFGRDRLAETFEGVEVFRGSGGFLGISSSANSTIVGKVSPNSAASQAGLRMRDRILAINEVPVNSFDDIRQQLGKHAAGDKIEIAIDRPVNFYAPEERNLMTLTVTLQEES